MAEKERLFLIDGSALAYRAYFAFVRNPLINSRGENVSAVFGFTKTLLKIVDDEKPDYLAVVFDTPEPTFRHKIYPDYKAQRAKMPADMVEQLPRIHEMCRVLNIPLLRLPGYEADDIMGTLAKQAEKRGLQTVLVSGDKDLMQLITSSTQVLNPRRSGEEPEWLDEKGVQTKLGLLPEQIVDYLALMGDSSDNIPGVAGVGPKGAQKLLQQYGALEQVFAHLDEIANKRLRTSLEGQWETALFSRELARIKCDLDLSLGPDDLHVGEPDVDTARNFFQQLEIQSLVDRFSERREESGRDYLCLQTLDQVKRLCADLLKAGEFAFDTETTSIVPLSAKLVGLSFSWKAGHAFYIPVAGPGDLTTGLQPLDRQKVLELLRPALTDEKIGKIAHNGKYDLLVLSRHGVDVRGLVFDTMVASYLVDPSARQHNLDAITLSELGIKKIATADLIGSGKNQKTMEQVPIERVSDYACEDADMTWRLSRILKKKLDDLGLTDLFVRVEMPLVGVLLRMEQNGVALDIPFLHRMSVELDEALHKLESEIYESAGEPFNIQSPKQLGAILFDKLSLPSVRKTKTGYSTDVTVLETLAERHELPRQILQYRQLAKLKSTYVDALPSLVNKESGRVHTSFNQTVAATGRLSSSDPNLQNIPIRTDIGRHIRRAFIPRSAENILLDADYSQIELRIMAHLSQDKTLCASFADQEDVHTRTAALVFGVEPDQVTGNQRRKAKEVNFGIMYGMGAYGLAQRLGIPPEEADEFIKSYFASYPGVQKYMIEIVEKTRERGYVTTLLDRRRYIPEILSENRRMREFAERTAINTPIQGSAADLIKLAMIRIHRRMHQEKMHSCMILQVHDELVFDVCQPEVGAMRELVCREMENAIELTVPIKVDMGEGKNWFDAH
ncbi:DNA polymerase I [candidate division KSB1 bacterium]|nr:DNA polymerase I [candidate division KSB1 bacterium]